MDPLWPIRRVAHRNPLGTPAIISRPHSSIQPSQRQLRKTYGLHWPRHLWDHTPPENFRVPCPTMGERDNWIVMDSLPRDHTTPHWWNHPERRAPLYIKNLGELERRYPTKK